MIERFFQMFFCVCPIGLLYFLSFCKWTWIGYINCPGMALTTFPSYVGWDKIWTHDLLIMNLALYPIEQSFPFTTWLARDSLNQDVNLNHLHFTSCFLLKYVFKTFLYLQFVFVIFCRNKIGATATNKMLMNWLQ